MCKHAAIFEESQSCNKLEHEEANLETHTNYNCKAGKQRKKICKLRQSRRRGAS